MQTLLFSFLFPFLALFNTGKNKSSENLNDFQYNNSFGLKIFTEITDNEDKEKNIMFSPLSLNIALMMAYNGADGETAKEMANVLELQGISIDEINKSYDILTKGLKSKDKDVKFSSANAVWLNKNIYFYSVYKEILRKDYDADVNKADFIKQKTVEDINLWVKDKTNGKIEKIIESIKKDATLILLNAIYFDGKWSLKFEEKDTKKKPFYLVSGKTIRTETMFIHSGIKVLSYGGNYQAVELPYGNGTYVMDLFMPYDSFSMDSLIGDLPEVLKKEKFLYSGERDVELFLPKFEYSNTFNLIPALKKLGINQAFNDSANFSKISKVPMKISMIKQKTFINTSEKGTEAAAVTVVEFVEICSVGRNSKPKPIIIIFDHPFLYVIRDTKTNAILFIGKVANPLAN